MCVSKEMASLVAQLVKNPPAMLETWVDPLEMGKAIHSNILAWRIPKGSQRVLHDWATFPSKEKTYSQLIRYVQVKHKSLD